ncbi:MAG: DUF4230 domain-containing protein [Bacteroidetes bacterium]|nr:MAG: DUF4230 domain-containing protein [Bacteroidota bacterium]
MFSGIKNILFLGIILALMAAVAYLYVFGNSKTVEITENHQTVVEKIESIGKLELVKYQIKDVLEMTKSTYMFLPTAKVILIASGEAVGCLDLTKIKAQNVKTSGDSIEISLPAPEICYYKLDHQKTKIYDTKFTIISGQQSKLLEESYKAAEKQIEKAALESNILEQTKINAQLILKPMLEQMTKKKVFLSFDLATKIENK